MEVCTSITLNSDASEKVNYNIPDFPAFIKKDSSQTILIFVLSANGIMMIRMKIIFWHLLQ